MSTKLFEVEVVRDGDIFIARITLQSGEVVSIESENLDEVLENLSSELQEKYDAL
ncbi:MAG: hypothetical protein ACP5NL_01045 [Thermoplasmata archaeon]